MRAQIISSALLLFVAGSALAAERAVEAIHYELDLDVGYYDSDLSGLSNAPASGKTLQGGLTGEVTVPVGKSWGASLAGGYSTSSGEAEGPFWSTETDTNQLFGVTNVFYRNPEFGRLSIGYELHSVDSSYSVNGGPSMSGASRNSYGYLGLAEGYVGSVTLGVNATRTYRDDSSPYEDATDSFFATASWYVTPDVRVGAQVGFDEADGTYVADVEFQPAFLSKMAGFYLGYARIDSDNVTADTIRLGFNFYFDKRFDLITRDRHYR